MRGDSGLRINTRERHTLPPEGQAGAPRANTRRGLCPRSGARALLLHLRRARGRQRHTRRTPPLRTSWHARSAALSATFFLVYLFFFGSLSKAEWRHAAPSPARLGPTRVAPRHRSAWAPRSAISGRETRAGCSSPAGRAVARCRARVPLSAGRHAPPRAGGSAARTRVRPAEIGPRAPPAVSIRAEYPPAEGRRSLPRCLGPAVRGSLCADLPPAHVRVQCVRADGKPGAAPDPKHVILMGTVCGTILVLNEFDLVTHRPMRCDSARLLAVLLCTRTRTRCSVRLLKLPPLNTRGSCQWCCEWASLFSSQ